MFCDIFSKEFNVGFSNPRVDVCTTCEHLLSKLKTEVDEELRKVYKREFKIHKVRSKAYYSMVKEFKNQPENHVVGFDLQQVQCLSKVPIQEAFYSRQIGLYNLGLCDVRNSKNYSFTRTEHQSER